MHNTACHYPSSHALNRFIVIVLGCILSLLPTSDTQARRGRKPPQALASFIDQLDNYDTARWFKADGWKNGSPFDNAWLADNISFDSGLMDIRLDDNATLGEPYASGNYQSNGFYGYGCYEASFKPVAKPGVISSFFTFAGPFDNGGNSLHNEIDFEFRGFNTSELQVNWWANDDSYSVGHEHIIVLNFDASQEFHRYGFKWTAAGIEWFVDGQSVYEVSNSEADPTPKANESLQKIMMNVWPVDDTASSWAGTFVYPGNPLHGHYAWVRHIAGEDCRLAEPPLPPPSSPPPTGNPSDLHVRDIIMSLNSRGTQAIASVVIENGQGEPTEAVDVYGSWSGIVITGDTHRTTDSDGTATFYSARTRDTGSMQFCVTNVSQDGKQYDPSTNTETCAVIDN